MAERFDSVFFQAVIQGRHRAGNRLPDVWEPLDGTGEQIDGQHGEQEDEPPRVVHVEKAESLVELQLGLAYGLQVFGGWRPLRDDGTDNRDDCQGDEQKHGELQPTEKVPEGLGNGIFLHNDAGSLMVRFKLWDVQRLMTQ